MGKVIADKYRVLEVLGQGGFGTVFLVEITAGMVGEKLALKILPEELSSQPSFRGQFLNEIRVAMRLVDKYIVQIRDVGTTEEGLLYYTMDYCAGTTLAQILREEGKIAISRALLIILNVLRALQTAHAAGIIHRDLKPANLMVESQGGKEAVKVLDLGIATLAEGGEKQKRFAGSPHYVPPEQFLGAEIGFYTDLYSLGVILYECITGRRPYPGSSAQEVFKNLKSRVPTPPEAFTPEVKSFPGLSELMMKALERNPERRFQSARELFDQLNAILVQGTAVEPREPMAPPSASPIRKAPERIRRRRVIRRSSSRTLEVILGTLLVLAVTLGALFHKEIARFWQAKDETSSGSEAGGPGLRDKSATSNAPLDPEDEPRAAKREDPTARSTVTAPSNLETSPLRPPQGNGQGTDGGAAVLEEQKKAAQAELQDRAKRFLAEGQEALQAKDWTTAIERADAILLQDPHDAEAHRLRGLSALKMGDYASADSSLEKANAFSHGEKVETGSLLALAEAKMNLSPPRLEEAETVALAAVRQAPKDSSAILLLIKVFEKEGKVEELKKVIAAARQGKVESPEIDKLWERYFVDDPKKKSEEAQRLLVLAREAFEKGDFKSAGDLSVQSEEKLPSLEAELIAADSFLELGEAEKGKDFVEKTLARARSDPGDSSSSRGREDLSPPAVEELEARLATLTGRSLLLRYQEKESEDLLRNAEASFADAGERLLKIDKKRQGRLPAIARLGLAETYALRGDLDRVVEVLKPVQGDSTPSVVAEQGRIYFLTGRKTSSKDTRVRAYDLARKRIVLCLKQRGLTPELKTRGHFLLGLCHLRLADLEGNERNYRLALDDFAEAQKAGLKSAELYEKWGTAYERTGSLIKAAQMFRSAFDIERTPSSCLRAAEYYLKVNPRSPEALSILKEGKELFPDNQEILKKYLELTR